MCVPYSNVLRTFRHREKEPCMRWNTVQLGILGLALFALAFCSYSYVHVRANLAHSEQMLEQVQQSIEQQQNKPNIELIQTNTSQSGCPEGLYFPIESRSNESIYLEKGQKRVICTSFTQ